MNGHEIIRAITEEYAEAVCRLEKQCFKDPWSEQLVRETIQCRSTEAAGLFRDNKLCGYYFAGSVLDEGELMNLCVDEAFRRQGFARKLLAHMVGKMRDKGVKRIFLEVRSRNIPARRLYLSEGYAEVGLRKDYYGDDDAVLMMKKLM